MSSVRILHLADLHVGMENYGRLDPATGLNGRVMDFLRRLNQVVEYSLENEVDLVIFAGDAYKRRSPSPTYQRAFTTTVTCMGWALVAYPKDKATALYLQKATQYLQSGVPVDGDGMTRIEEK